jgi:hypothetical protein
MSWQELLSSCDTISITYFEIILRKPKTWILVSLQYSEGEEMNVRKVAKMPDMGAYFGSSC